MGNKMCKKKVDSVDHARSKSPTPFDRIINRLHLRPNTWKSDSQLNEKHAKRCDVNLTNPSDRKNNIVHTQPLSKSSDWTEVELEVPEKEHVHLRNPKLSIIFNDDKNGTPTPPPRKHKKNFREKIEAVAKTGLQAFQPKKQEKQVPVEEVFVKKTINYKCPVCDSDEATHNRDHHHHHHNHKHDVDKNKNENRKEAKQNNVKLEKDKRKKNLSTVSLPNYDELKLTVANFDDTSKVDPIHSDRPKTALISHDIKKPLTSSTGRLDSYITRCRSFGSLLPQQLKKLKLRNAPADIESDDSFGGLEDWDLGLIEHYNPKDTSLPRPRKPQRSSQDVMADLECLIVKEEDLPQPKPPVRRSESLVKKINREAAQSAQNLKEEKPEVSKNPTPPPSPAPKVKKEERLNAPQDFATKEDGKVEHSSLLKILEGFSIRQVEENYKKVDEPLNKTVISSTESSLTPSLVDFEKNLNSIEEFINAEKISTDRDLNFGNSRQTLVS